MRACGVGVHAGRLHLLRRWQPRLWQILADTQSVAHGDRTL
ncbi:hypothetical protein ACQ4WX_02460 [Streptomyces lasalocidi]